MNQFFLTGAVLTSLLLAGCGAPTFTWVDVAPPHCSDDAGAQFACVLVVEGIEKPIWAQMTPFGEYWVLSQLGQIFALENGVLSSRGDIRSLTVNCHLEQGLLGIAFPDGANHVLLSYTAKPSKSSCGGLLETRYDKGDLVVGQFELNQTQIVVESARELYRVEEPYRNHNGGHMRIGPDGLLYLGVGDGGDHSDPLKTGQNPKDSLGSLLRFEWKPNQLIPAGAGVGGAPPELLFYGLRNPWRFDFHPDGENIWLTDVGQACFEEVNFLPIESGANLGWSKREGRHEYAGNRANCLKSEYAAPDDQLVDPIWEYPHVEGHCSITGGFWLDENYGSLSNSFVVGDFCTGRIWKIFEDDDDWAGVSVMDSGSQITSFALGPAGELYILHWGGAIFELREATS